MRIVLLLFLVLTLVEIEMPTAADAAEWRSCRAGKCGVRAGGCINGKCKRPVRR